MRLLATSYLCLFSFIPLCMAGVNSGGGLGRVGPLYSFGSIGSPFATGLRSLSGGSNRTGFVPVLTPWHTSPGVQDTDGDGMSDAWETTHGLNPNVANASLDSDFDGVSDYQEFVTGTHPLQAGSRLTATAFKETAQVRLECPTLPGRKYRIERSTNLTNWTLHEEINGDGNTLQSLIPVLEGQTLGFYQIIITMYRP